MTTVFRNALHALVLVCVVGLSAILQFHVVATTEVADPIRADAEKYVSYAWNLQQHGVYSHINTWEAGTTPHVPVPDKLALPGYPLLLAALLEGYPDERFVRRVQRLQATLGVLSTLLAFLIAWQLLPFRWAAGVGVLVATSPHMMTISTYLLTEALFTTLVLASVYAALRALRTGAGLTWWLAAGLLLGTTCLVRPQLQLVPFFILGASIFVRRWRPFRTRVLLATLCFVAVLSPWFVRNSNVPTAPDQPSLLVNTLYHGSFPNMMRGGDPKTYGFPYQDDPDAPRITRDLPSVLGHLGTSFTTQPGRYLSWYAFGKPGFFLSWGIVGGVGGVFIHPVFTSPFLDDPAFLTLRSVNFLVHWPLMLLALTAACAMCWRPGTFRLSGAAHTAAILLSLLLFYLIAIHMIGAPFPRYAIPFRPLFYTLAVLMLRAIWLRLRNRPPRPSPAPRQAA